MKTSFYTKYPDIPISDSLFSYLKYYEGRLKEDLNLPLWAKPFYRILHEDPILFVAYGTRPYDCCVCTNKTRYYISGVGRAIISAIYQKSGDAGNMWIHICSFECFDEIKEQIINEAIFLGVVNETD